MKKIIIVAVSIICFCAFLYSIFVNDEQYPTKISLSKTEIECEINDEFYITDTVKIKTDCSKNQTLYFACNGLNINSRTGYVIADSVGEYEITIKTKSSKNEYISTTLILRVKNTIYPTTMNCNFDIMNMYLGEPETNAIIFDNPSANTEVVVEYSQSGIISYNTKTFVVSPMSIGSCTIILKTKSSRDSGYDIECSFDVVVVAKDEEYINKSLGINEVFCIELKDSYSTMPNITISADIIQIVEMDISYVTIKAMQSGDCELTISCKDCIYHYNIHVE